MINHDDAEREFAYAEKDDASLKAAAAHGWNVVDMKKDWNTVLPPVIGSPLTAIDILLDPDATMMKHAEAVNARLRSVYPAGFALDAAHQPHVTLIQRYVRAADLDKVYAAANKVLAGVKVTDFRLKAFKYYYVPVGDLGLSGIVAEPTPELLELQADLIAAVAPYTAPTATAAAFFTTPDEPGIQKATIDYIAGFVPDHTGANYSPHVTTGLAPRGYLDKMLAEPFETFTFSPASVSVYQLGEFGTAAKKLKELDSKR